VEEERVSIAFVVPAMVELIIHHPDFGERDLSSLMMVSVGSAPISPSTLQTFHEALPNASVSNSYSMTEAGQAYCVMAPEEFHRRVGSVGKPIPPLEIEIVDEDTDEVLAPNEVGEIRLRNPGRQREYFRDPEATAQTWDEGGWLRTGDLGKLDDDGFLYIVGRMKDVIIRGGHNVHAKDVEDVLYAMEGIREAAVIGIPHDVLGEDIAAVVVPAPGASITPDDVMAWCQDRLADYKRPRRVQIVEELPRSAMGKVLKRELVDGFGEKV
jgi:acyl-CoA synthetase (AMP-forming)/AMP-acid ligase II